MCHLKPHSENPKQADLNDVTKQFAEIVKAVDNFHFKKGKYFSMFLLDYILTQLNLGHKGKWCQTNANPNIEMKKVGMTHANTPVCEQTFSWLNKFKNIKSMNEAHFKLFMLYILDLHNLHIEKKVDLLANPLNPRRKEEIQKLNDEIVLEGFEKLSLNTEAKEVVSNIPHSGSSDVGLFSEELDDCFSQLPDGELSCNFCSGIFKRIGNMRNHLNSKHQMFLCLKCTCGKKFQDSTKLSRHQKTCKNCLNK